MTAVSNDQVVILAAAREQFLNFVTSRVKDPALAEDILQDALLKAVQAAPTLRDESRLVPWFYTILRNAITDAYRSRAAATRYTIPLAADFDAPEGSETLAVLCQCFRALLPSLSPDYAELIEVLDLQEVSTAATAERLKLTPNNLKVKRHRARQALRRRLEETCRVCAEHHCLDCTCQSE